MTHKDPVRVDGLVVQDALVGHVPEQDGLIQNRLLVAGVKLDGLGIRRERPRQ